MQLGVVYNQFFLFLKKQTFLREHHLTVVYTTSFLVNRLHSARLMENISNGFTKGVYTGIIPLLFFICPYIDKTQLKYSNSTPLCVRHFGFFTLYIPYGKYIF